MVNPKKRDNPAILDGTYFVIESTDSNGIVTAKCLTCVQNGSEGKVKGKMKPTSNFTTHLKKVHPIVHTEYQDYLNSPQNKNKRMNQQTLSFPKTGESAGQSKANALILDFVIGSMSSLSIVENPHFKNLVQGLNPKAEVPSRRTLSRKLQELNDKTRQKIKNMLKDVKSVCVTADIWSSNKRSFMGVTCHWINDELQRRLVILALKRFQGSHTYDRIAEILHEVFSTYDLNHEKIEAVVTDNGSNFFKAFKEYGIEVETGEDTENQDDATENPEEDAEQLLDLELPLPELVLPKHLRCASHTLSLVATDQLELDAGSKRLFGSLMSKYSALWNKISNRSTKVCDQLEALCGKAIIKPVPTRWNSLYDAMKRLHELQDHLKEVCEIVGVKKFTPEDFELMEDFIAVMGPVASALDKLQSEKEFSYGHLAPTISKTKEKLEAFVGAAPEKKFRVNLAKSLLKSLNARFSELCLLDKEKSRNQILAAILNPFFKLRWIPEDRQEEFKQFFISEAKAFHRGKVMTPEPTVLVEDEFFDFPVAPTASVVDSSFIEVEFIKFLQDGSTSLEALHKFPLVKEMFRAFNTPLPSSAPAERLFSFAKMVLQPRRYSLSDERFESLVLLKLNMNIQD